MDDVHGEPSRHRGKRAIAVVGTEQGRTALEADLAIRGLNLYQLKMWQIRGCIRSLASDPTTQTCGYLTGVAPISHGALLMLIYDVLEGANWQRTGRKSGRPKRFYQRLQEEAQRRRAADRPDLTEEQLLELALADPALASQPWEEEHT